MLAMMLPTIGLYELSIWMVERVARKQAAAQSSSTT
jgi:Sec-independent protein secretion pathway component TatC